MRREHRVISALRRHARCRCRAPIDVVDDTAAAEVTGTVFFVMELVDGHRARPPVAERRATPPTGCAALSLELAEHPRRPARRRSRRASGSRDFGRPDGYLDRQLRTWRRQLDASRSRETARARRACRTASPSGDARLRAAPAIVHGDYRLDNALVVGDGRRRRASRRSSTGRWRRSATRSSTSASSACTGTSATCRAAARRRAERRRPGRRLPGVRRAGRRLRGARGHRRPRPRAGTARSPRTSSR